MKFTSTLFALAATTSFSAVVADNCFGNWNWCGWALLNKGDYKQMMSDKVRQAGLVNPTDAVLSNTLFRCRKDGNGEIDFQQVCVKGCTYGGSSDSSDYCN